VVRARIKGIDLKKCCPVHRVPAVKKLLTCTTCGADIEFEYNSGSVSASHCFCPKCRKDRHNDQCREYVKAYTTEDEIAFVKSLPKDRLQKYINTIPLRSNWEGLNKNAIIAACNKRIKNAK